jgi:alkylation response protein AidB-like acyl-CoA dehydrogenase
MDFSPSEYTKKQEEFAEEVRAWLDENIPEGMTFPRDPLKVSHEQFEKRREFARRIGRKGWLYPSYPREYGGGGLDAAHSAVIMREVAKRGLGLPPFHNAGAAYGVPVTLAFGTEEQKKRLLPPILRDGALTWELFTEPEAGSDEANQQTNALRHTRDKDYFIINGSKIFVGGLYSPADLFLLLTRSDLEAPRHENLAMFLAPANLPGIEIIPLDLFVPGPFGTVSGESTVGADGIKHQIVFDDVRIHESYLIGGERDGWKVANAALEVEHAIRPGGGEPGGFMGTIRENFMAQRFLERCKSDPNIVKRLRENPQLVESMVNVYIGAEKERLYAIRNAGRKGGVYGGTQSQLYSKVFALTLTYEIAKVLGPYALTSDDKWGLDDSLFEVGQRGALCLAPMGTPEITKIVIARLLAIGR